jgi:hypothetical protein
MHKVEPEDFQPEAVNTVVRQLAYQGVLIDTSLATGERALVLQIGYIESYAGSLILLARNNPRGVPALEVLEVLFRRSFPGIKDDDRKRLGPLEGWRDHSKVRVHTRCLRRDGGAWEGWAVWPDPTNPLARLTYYDIVL